MESAIQGDAVDEDLVGIRVYGRSKNWVPTDDSCARDGLSRLKKLVAAYYAADGIEDRLNLEFDRYIPIFSYNVRHPVEQHMRAADRYIGSDPKVAFRHLCDIIGIEPSHAEAMAGMAEVEIWRIFYGYDMGLPNFLEPWDIQVKKALEFDANCWRAHVVMGALHCFRHRWTDARSSFESALLSSPTQTRAHPWYAAFLMATGETKAALDLVKLRASEPSDSPWPQLTYAVFLYAGRYIAEASEVLRKAVVEENNRRFFDVMRYFTLFAGADFPTNDDRIHLGAMTEVRPETLEQWYPIFSFVCFVFELDPDYFEYELVKEGIKDLARMRLEHWTKATTGEEADHTGPYLSPFQLAIGYLAIGEIDRAVELLEVDLNAGHPLLAWLHLWPIFDLLRDHPKFKILIERMHLPKIDGQP